MHAIYSSSQCWSVPEETKGFDQIRQERKHSQMAYGITKSVLLLMLELGGMILRSCAIHPGNACFIVTSENLMDTQENLQV